MGRVTDNDQVHERKETVMSLRILIVPDKFKGTLTARQAAAAIARGWTDVRHEDRVEELPMSDGGDGFGEVLGHLLRAQRQTCATVDSAGRPRAAEWWLEPNDCIAVIETAQVNGLALLPAGEYHPFQLDTFGIGALLKDAKQAGARDVYVGIGGSSTNDGGFGLARSLGWSFWSGSGTELRAWTELDQLARVEAPFQRLAFHDLTIAVDVSNPLLGANGASRVYGPQKGLGDADILKAEACLSRLAQVIGAQTGEDVSLEAGSGAAGGLGFGLRAFCGGIFRSGGEIFAKLSQLERRIQDADLVITAEGAMDLQTLMGKGVGVIAEAAARAGKPCFCFAGSVSVDSVSVPWPNFKSFSIVPRFATLEDAKAHADDCLRRLAAHVASKVYWTQFVSW
jgi:glycerate 2-kinase